MDKKYRVEEYLSYEGWVECQRFAMKKEAVAYIKDQIDGSEGYAPVNNFRIIVNINFKLGKKNG